NPAIPRNPASDRYPAARGPDPAPRPPGVAPADVVRALRPYAPPRRDLGLYAPPRHDLGLCAPPRRAGLRPVALPPDPPRSVGALLPPPDDACARPLQPHAAHSARARSAHAPRPGGAGPRPAATVPPPRAQRGPPCGHDR